MMMRHNLGSGDAVSPELGLVDSDDCETKKDEERAGSAAYTCGKTTRSGQKAIMREDPCWNWGAYDALKNTTWNCNNANESC
jgi:hypothetical protein